MDNTMDHFEEKNENRSNVLAPDIHPRGGG
jgi:hypothetical protein